MKALTLTQPWATLVALQAKRYETRSWRTIYRGPLAIHAAKGFGGIGGVRQFERILETEPFRSVLWERSPRKKIGPVEILDELPTGAIIAVCDLADVLPTPSVRRPMPWLDVSSLSAREQAFGDFSQDRFAWRLENVQPLPEPIPCAGARGLWNVPDELLSAVAA